MTFAQLRPPSSKKQRRTMHGLGKSRYSDIIAPLIFDSFPSASILFGQLWDRKDPPRAVSWRLVCSIWQKKAWSSCWLIAVVWEDYRSRSYGHEDSDEERGRNFMESCTLVSCAKVDPSLCCSLPRGWCVNETDWFSKALQIQCRQHLASCHDGVTMAPNTL